jgi:5-methylcytosine-specific restriction protein A
MTRPVKEWIGKHDGQAVPPHVRARIFDACGGRCHLSGRLIRAGERWDLDHIVALVNGGEHRELNLAPVLCEPHRKKTREDVRIKSKNYRKRAYHLGIKRKKGRPIMGNKNSGWKKCLDGTVVKR